jgi:type IV pilus assembly protein PilV
MHSFKSFNKHLRGFTLVEVLMAVFVLAIALTGMMRLHLTALRAQRQSSYQTIAVQLAGDMAEMIRAWSAPGSDDPFLFNYRAGDALPAAMDCNGGAQCEPAALRQFGIGQWLETLQAALPMARVSICRDATPWDDSAGAFKWPCSGDDAGVVIKLGWRTASGASGRSSSMSASTSEPQRPQLVLNIGEPAA